MMGTLFGSRFCSRLAFALAFALAAIACSSDEDDCTTGECTATWVGCRGVPSSSAASCAQECESLGLACVANGCGAGATYFYTPEIGNCEDLIDTGSGADITYSSDACDAAFPITTGSYVSCCCANLSE